MFIWTDRLQMTYQKDYPENYQSVMHRRQNCQGAISHGGTELTHPSLRQSVVQTGNDRQAQRTGREAGGGSHMNRQLNYPSRPKSPFAGGNITKSSEPRAKQLK